ncbi:MAG: hypothetical protein ACI8X5_003882 [Planctomycetota bacterium]|jgi:hypothetical protein
MQMVAIHLVNRRPIPASAALALFYSGWFITLLLSSRSLLDSHRDRSSVGHSKVKDWQAVDLAEDLCLPQAPRDR